MARFFFVAGSLAAAVAVMAGAFGAHALEGSVSSDRLQTFETAVRYQMYHALGLLAMSAFFGAEMGGLVQWAGYLFIAGIIVFAGSLYLLVLTDTPWLGAVTPFGGVAFIVGWLLLAGAALRG